MKNNIFKIFASFCAMVFTLAGCQQAELDTAQYKSDEVTLASFGPNPAMRGGTVTFYGSNLEQITQVSVPGMGNITDIEVVKSGTVSEIRIVLDSETPEVGYITLKTSDGKEFTTKSELTYKEPIVFDGFSTANEVCFPGDIVTINGTYVDLIKTVTFEGGAKVDVEDGATRHSATVKIPASAITGKIILSDGEEIESLFYSENDLVIGEPTVQKAEKAVYKAGETFKITGNYLNMIENLEIGSVIIDTADFTLSEDNSSIEFAIPATATDGTVNAVSFASAKYDAGEIETVVPTGIEAGPSPVKAGKELIIKGKDLDLITSIDFNGAKGANFFYDDSISVTVPATAKEGEVVLNLDNGKTVKTNVTLVCPTITSVSPLELYAGDESIVVEGTDLDLVTSVTLGGKTESFTSEGETKLSISTQATSVSGKIVVTLGNGVEINSEEEITVKYHSLVVVSERPAGEHIGQEVILKGSNFDLVENIFIGETKVTKYSLRTAEEVRFLVPWVKVGSYDLVFKLFNGDVETQAEKFEVGLELDIKNVWTGESAVTWSAGAVTELSWGNGKDNWGTITQPLWQSVKAGTKLIVYFKDVAESDAVIRVANGNWTALPTTKSYSNADGDGNLSIGPDNSYVSVTLTDADLEQMTSNGGLVICGTGYTVTSIELVSEISQEKALWEGSVTSTGWDNHELMNEDVWVNAGISVGSEVKIYFTTTDPTGYVIQIFDGHWTKLFHPEGDLGLPAVNATSAPTAVDDGYFKFTVNQDLYNCLASTKGWGCGLILQGPNVTFTKITIL